MKRAIALCAVVLAVMMCGSVFAAKDEERAEVRADDRDAVRCVHEVKVYDRDQVPVGGAAVKITVYNGYTKDSATNTVGHVRFSGLLVPSNVPGASMQVRYKDPVTGNILVGRGAERDIRPENSQTRITLPFTQPRRAEQP